MDVAHDTINSTRRSGSERSCLLSVGRRCQILFILSLDQPSAPTTCYDGHSKTWLANDGPPHSRALMSYGNSWLKTILMAVGIIKIKVQVGW
jgi:hypothetical protein